MAPKEKTVTSRKTAEHKTVLSFTKFANSVALEGSAAKSKMEAVKVEL